MRHSSTFIHYLMNMHTDSNRILYFLLFTIVFQALLDFAVLKAWISFVRKQQWSETWLIQPFIYLAGFMFSAGLYAVWERVTFGNYSQLGFIVQLCVFFWYLPKLPIALFLLGRSIIHFFRYLYKKINSSIKPHDEISQNIESKSDLPIRSRREFLSKVGWSAASIPFIITGDGLFRTVYDFRVYRVELVLNSLPAALDGITIAQLSDIHSGSFPDNKPMKEVLRILQELKPDIITITGDYVNFKPDELSVTFNELAQLSAPLGVYGSLGNHDHYMTDLQHALLKNTISKTGIQLLVNDSVNIPVHNTFLNIAATDNTGFNQHFANIDKAISKCHSDTSTILLAHDPTFWDAEILSKKPIDLMLAGHTHGGQIGIQFAGLEISPAQFVYKRWAGLYNEGHQYLYVNRGIGTVGPPIRIGINPEITLFTLRSKIA